MNILLLRPPAGETFRWKSPPLGIASIAAFIRTHLKDLVEVTILDLLPVNQDIEYVINTILTYNPEVVGVSFLTAQAPFSYALANELQNNGIITVAGGAHPTVCFEEVASNGFNYVVRGEGEQAFLKIINKLLIDKLSKSHVLPVSAQSGEIIHEPLLKGKDIPFPAWELINFNAGYNEKIGDKQAAPIMFSRGCAFSCSFCASATIWQKKIRWRNAKSVVDELIYLGDVYGIRSFHFYDDDFLVSKKHLFDILDEMKRIPYSIEWVALSTVHSICQNKDLLPLVKKSGCKGFDVGIESADISVLSQAGKNQNYSSSKQALILLKNHGFSYIEPLMMYFNEGETTDSIKLEVDFFHDIGMQVLTVDMHQYATPFPGTTFFQTSKFSGVSFQKSWCDYRTDRINFIPTTFLSSNFPDISFLDVNNIIEQEVDWNGALNRSDGKLIAKKVWEVLYEIPKHNPTSVSNVTEECLNFLSVNGQLEREAILKIVALFAIIGARSKANMLKRI